MPTSVDSLPPNRLRELRRADRSGRSTFRQLSTLVGRHFTTYHRYETGEVPIPDAVKIALAEHYDVSVEYLMGWDTSRRGSDAVREAG